MSVDHLKKQAKNAKRLLPGLYQQHPPPYSLAECQELTAGLNGYPSWRIALETQRRKPIQRDDPIAAFYGYDWRKVSATALVGLDDPARCQVKLHQLAPDEAMDYLVQKGKSERPPLPTVLINAAGEDGGKVIDCALDTEVIAMNFTMVSLTTFSHRLGATFNPVAGLTAANVAQLLASIISPVASPRQVQCSREVVELLLSGMPQEEMDIPTIQQAVDRLICLDNGGWSKNDEDFYETFPDEDRHDDADDLMDRYADEMLGLLRPLDAMLTRLSAPGQDLTFSPRRCAENHEGREEFFKAHDELGVCFVGLELIQPSLSD